MLWNGLPREKKKILAIVKLGSCLISLVILPLFRRSTVDKQLNRPWYRGDASHHSLKKGIVRLPWWSRFKTLSFHCRRHGFDLWEVLHASQSSQKRAGHAITKTLNSKDALLLTWLTAYDHVPLLITLYCSKWKMRFLSTWAKVKWPPQGSRLWRVFSACMVVTEHGC